MSSNARPQKDFPGESFADSEACDASVTRGRRGRTISHERDHDACPYISVRRSFNCIQILKNMKKTSPLSFSHILASFSVKNDFMFYPPVPTYTFFKDESGNLSIADSVEPPHFVSDTGRPKHRDAYVVPRHDAGAVHGLPYTNECSGRASFEVIFIPWDFTLQCYRIRGDNLVMERKISFSGRLFLFSFGGPMPCSIIRPKHRMSSHVGIFFHCNGEDIGRSSSLRLLSLANALHITILVPEFPGYGLFEGKPSEASVKAALEHFVQYLLAVNPFLSPSRILLLGHSIGTGFAMHIAKYIHTFFSTLQCTECRNTVCPLSYVEDLRATKKNSYFHPTHRYHCGDSGNIFNGESREPFDATSTPSSSASDKPVRCCHNTLAGIILLSPFASIHCVEYHNALKRYNLHPDALDKRMWDSPTEVVFPAPEEWAEDCSTQDSSYEHRSQVPDPPWLFRVAHYLSFNRLPSIEVAMELQEKYDYFNYTPLLLIHGTHDALVPAYNSVAIATKIRQCPTGRKARVFLSLLYEAEHNNLNCVSQGRRFYKSEVLEPHTRKQREFARDLAVATQGVGVNEETAHFAPFEFTTGPLADDSNNNFTIRVTHQDSQSASGKDRDPLSLRSSCSSNTDNLLKGEHLYFLHLPPPEGPDTSTLHPENSRQLHSEPMSREISFLSESISLNNSMLHTAERIRPEECTRSFLPAATAIHLTMYPPNDWLDIGSFTVAAVQHYALPLEEALRLRRRHIKRKIVYRVLRSLLYILPSYVVLAVGIAHAVLLQHGRLSRYMKEHGITSPTAEELSLDSRVVIWAVLESLVLFIFFIIQYASPYFGLGHVSSRAPNRQCATRVFQVTYVVSVALCFAAGVLMGMILSLTPHHRGGIEWSKWEVLPYDRRVWVASVPRWLMLGVACFHLAALTLIVITNH